MVASLAAALSYAVGGTFIRRNLAGVGGVELATGQLTSGALLLLPFAVLSGPGPGDEHADAVLRPAPLPHVLGPGLALGHEHVRDLGGVLDADYTLPMHIIAKTGTAFQGEPATLGTILSAGAVVMLIVVVFVSLLALVRLVLVR